MIMETVLGGFAQATWLVGKSREELRLASLEDLSSNLGFTTYLPVAHENLISEPVSSSVKWVIMGPPFGFYGVQMRCYVWAPYLSEEEQGSAGMGSFLFLLFPTTSISLLPLGGLLFHSSP